MWQIPRPMLSTDAPHPLQIQWLVRLRWSAVFAQIASVLGTRFLLHAPFPLPPLVAIISALAAANVLLSLALRRRVALSDRAVALNLLLDTAALTGVLVYTGGAMNPFTTLYLLHVALAGILVPRRWSLVVTFFAALAFGGLLLARPEAIHVWHSGAMFLLHVRGMWLAFALTAGCLWYFVDRVVTALRRREEELAAARLERARTERVAALGTLAAGTAHELNTPLGTVAILAAELSELLEQAPEARAHADKIRAEIKRCKEILTKMRSHERATEPRVNVDAEAWVAQTVEAWRERRESAVELRVAPGARGRAVRVQRAVLAQALHNVLDNAALALDGRAGAAPIEVRVEPAGEARVTVAVVDRGAGIPPEHLARVCEPFFTTREPGRGTGLGLFLAEAAAQQHDGTLEVASGAGETRVAITLPVV